MLNVHNIGIALNFTLLLLCQATVPTAVHVQCSSFIFCVTCNWGSHEIFLRVVFTKWYFMMNVCSLKMCNSFNYHFVAIMKA